MVTRNRVGLILLLCTVLVVTLLTQQSLQGAPEVQATPCFSQTKQGIVFGLLGYEAQADGSTIVRYRITNPGPRALDAVVFTAKGWTPVAPGERTVYSGALGGYDVRWALHNLIPSHEALRFQPQGNWFKTGAQETFVLTVRNFDPQRQLFAWVRANLRLTQMHLKPIDYNCLLTSPAPSPTPTVTTPPESPLPTPNPALTLDDYSFSEPRVVLTNPVSIAVMEWLPDSRHAFVSQGLTRTLQLLDTTTGQTVPFSTQTIAPGDPIVWLNSSQQAAFLAGFTPAPGENAAGKSALYLSRGLSDLKQVTTGLLMPTIAGRGDQVMLVHYWDPTPQRFNSNDDALSLPPINLHDYGINTRQAHSFLVLRWHPYEPKVAIFDSGGFIIFNVETGAVQSFDIGDNNRPFLPYALLGEWSPDGTKMALVVTQWRGGLLESSSLAVLEIATGVLQPMTLPPLSYIPDIAWAPNSRQLIAVGNPNVSQGINDSQLFLVDIQTNRARQIERSSEILWTSTNSTVAWSPDGHKILYRCQFPNAVPGVCELMVVTGGE